MMDWVVITICVALLLAVNVLWGVAYWRLVDNFTKMMERARLERSCLLEDAARERGLLMDRIQAKDLQEYKTLNREIKPPEPKEPKEIIRQI